MTTKIIIRQCDMCGEKFRIKVNYEDYLKWEKQNYSNTEKIFPYLSFGDIYRLTHDFCGPMCAEKDWNWGC